MARHIVLTPETWRRVSALLNARDSGVVGLGTVVGRGARWCIVRCDSAAPIGVATGNYLDQMYAATIVYLSSDISYPPLGLVAGAVGDGCLLTVLGTDSVSGDSPYAIVPVVGKLYAGQLTAEVDADPAVAAYVPARRRLIAIDHYGAAGGGGGSGPAGVNGSVQFNDAGAFGADPLFSYDKVSDTLFAPHASVSDLVAVDFIQTTNGPITAAIASSAYAKLHHSVTGKARLSLASDKTGGGFVTANFELADTGGPGGALGARHVALFDDILAQNVAFAAGGFGIRGAAGALTWGASGTGGTVTAVNGVVTAIAAGGSGTVTSVSGGTTGLTVTNPTTTPTLGGTLAIANGGTGATTAAGARISLGLAIGVDVQAAFADPGADRLIAWDDSLGVAAPIALADISTITPVSGDYFIMYSASGALVKADWDDLPGVADGDYTDISVSSSGNVFTIKPNVVTDTKLRDSAALSVIGRSANSTGDPADIAAGTDGHVLRRSGAALGFGTLAAGAFADNTIAPARLAMAATARLVGRSTAGAGLGEELTGAQATALLSAFIAAGGTAAKGLVPAPGATAHTNWPYYLGDDGAFHASYELIGVKYIATDETCTATVTPALLATNDSMGFNLDENTNLIVVGIANYYDTASAQNGFMYADLDGTPTAIGGTTTNGANFLEMLVGGIRYAAVASGARTVSLKFVVGGGTGHFRWRILLIFRGP